MADASQMIADLDEATRDTSRALRALWRALAALDHSGLTEHHDQLALLADGLSSAALDLTRLRHATAWHNGSGHPS